MHPKTIKFRSHLAELVAKGEKTSTWRLFDDKDLSVGDIVDFINWDTGVKFAEAKLTDVYEKTLSTLEDADWVGHEKFASEEEMYATYKTYYGDGVGPDTVVKIIHFVLL